MIVSARDLGASSGLALEERQSGFVRGAGELASRRRAEPTGADSTEPIGRRLSPRS